MKKQKGILIAIIVLLVLGAFKCPLYNIFGVPCPTCGMTRSWQNLLSGNVEKAFSMHPLFFLPLVFFIPKARTKWVLYTVFGVFIAVYIIRMILLFPHTVPMNFNYDSLIGGLLL